MMPIPAVRGVPVHIQLGRYALHPHFVFEALAYFVGFRLYLFLRRRHGDPLPSVQRGWLIVAVILGAVVGSKALAWASDPLGAWREWGLVVSAGGKSIVGALLGGWAAVELTKRRLGIRRATGDLYVVPLAVGIAIGRIGCFLTGLSDRTHGIATTLPWGVDFGDGVARHPTQLYEIAFLLVLAAVLLFLATRPHGEGDLWKAFVLTYLGYRFLVAFIQPGIRLAGLTAIQWASLAGVLVLAPHAPRLMQLLVGSPRDVSTNAEATP
jgi:phosphatidylglycerol---prolipoprotein diacylglyceryl transferase